MMMDFIRMLGQPCLGITTALVMAVIWRLLYICDAFMNVVWMNAAIMSMALGIRELFTPLGRLALTLTAGFLTLIVMKIIAYFLVLLKK